MRGHPILTEEAQAAVDAKNRYGDNNVAAEALGISESGVRRRLKRAAQLGMLGFKPVLPGFEVTRSSTNTATGESWVRQAPEPGAVFEIPPGQTLKGVSALIDPDGREMMKWVKTKEDVTSIIAEALEQRFAKYDRPIFFETERDTNEHLMSVYPIADQHLGLLAWGKETGDDYDLKIGSARLRDCTKRLVAQSPPSETALILNLGDWQHTDDARNVTPGHQHVLDVDSRYFKIVMAGVDLMVDIVELALQKHKNVILRNLPGNHDPNSHVALTMGLRGWFRNHPRVTVLTDPSEFFYYRFHNCFIGATHGHKIKPKDMVMDMAVVCRDDWAAADYRYFYFGHIHHETALEVGDVRCESFQTLASKDAYNRSHGYHAGRSLVGITLHDTDGEIGRHRINLPSPQKKRNAK